MLGAGFLAASAYAAKSLVWPYMEGAYYSVREGRQGRSGWRMLCIALLRAVDGCRQARDGCVFQGVRRDCTGAVLTPPLSNLLLAAQWRGQVRPPPRPRRINGGSEAEGGEEVSADATRAVAEAIQVRLAAAAERTGGGYCCLPGGMKGVCQLGCFAAACVRVAAMAWRARWPRGVAWASTGIAFIAFSPSHRRTSGAGSR